MKKLLALVLILGLCACGKSQDMARGKEPETRASFETIRDFLLEKLFGQTLIRDYGKDSGKTKIIFEKNGKFRGDYFGKIASDGKDYGLSDTAAIYYHAEEIHSSDFEGKFEITKMLDEYSYELRLKEFTITSDEGAHDDIYYNVDFALGLNKDANYILYRPGCKIDRLKKDDRLIEIAKDHSQDGEKIRGFIIYNETDDEVFFQP